MQQGQYGQGGMTEQGLQAGQQRGMMGQALDKDGCVLTCTVTDCSYNKDIECYAPQIQVGDDHPTCDTYTHNQVQMKQKEGFVAMCGVTQCHFNESEACHARGITVDLHQQHADCATFRP